MLEILDAFSNKSDKYLEDIIKEKGWIQISDEGAIKEVVAKIIEANPQMLNKMFAEELKK